MEILISKYENLDEIVKVHLSAFSGFFLTELGEKFLKLYYKCVLDSDCGILLSCLENNEIVGFCAACTHSGGFNMNLIKSNPWSFGIIGLQLLATKPKALIRLARNLTKKGNLADNGDYGELLSIGVLNDAQNKGVGKLLLIYLESTLKRLNVSQLSLTTDYDNNEQALNFYSKIGFKSLYEFIAYPDRKMYRLIKDLNS